MSPRRTGGRTRLHAPARNNRSRGGSSKKGLIISLGIIGIAAIGLLIYFLIPKGGDNFSMKKLDKYVEEMNPSTQVNPGASVYLDFSNGMIDAYATPEAQHVLKCVIDKLNGPKTGYEFFSLASDSITAMQNMSQTELYNRIMNPASYDQERAPIEATLRTIVDRNQAAVLVTDFEEYNNGRITVIDENSGEPLCFYDLSSDFTTEDAMVVGSFTVNDSGDWEFEALGKGYNGGLQTLVEIYAS